MTVQSIARRDKGLEEAVMDATIRARAVEREMSDTRAVDPDLSDAVDAEPLARLLATPTFDVDACSERIVQYLREGVGPIAEMAKAFKAHVGERLADDKPAMIALLTYTRHGAFSAELGERVHRIFGYPMWGDSWLTHLFDTTPRAARGVMEHLHAHAGGDIDRVAHDLMMWVELGDEAARDRLHPVALRAGRFALDDLVGCPPVVMGRLLDVSVLDLPRLEDKVEQILTNAEKHIYHHLHVIGLAGFFDLHEGPSPAPPFEVPNSPQAETTRIYLDAFWRLIHRFPAQFERHLVLFPGLHALTKSELRYLLTIDEQASVADSWRIMRAGRVVLTSSGKNSTHLPRLKAVAFASEAAARKQYATRLTKALAKQPAAAKPKAK